MTVYAFWNNKGGVGKTFLSFVSGCEYAHQNPGHDIYMLDMCPQANLSDTLLGGYQANSKHVGALIEAKPRKTMGGYLDARLNSPFKAVDDVEPFIVKPYTVNRSIPENLFLVCGDNLLEIQAEAIRQYSQLSVPENAWIQVMSWLQDLVKALRKRSGDRPAKIIIDCNPSFAAYTQLAMVAAEYVVVPFTSDESSRRAIENVVTLLYGVGTRTSKTYKRLSFSHTLKESGVQAPRIHTFVVNQVTMYGNEPAAAFRAMQGVLAGTVDEIWKEHRDFFARPDTPPSESFVEVPDHHSACIVATVTGTPLHRLKPGPQKLPDGFVEQPTLNKDPLDRYREALHQLVERL